MTALSRYNLRSGCVSLRFPLSTATAQRPRSLPALARSLPPANDDALTPASDRARTSGRSRA